jgi:predicted ATPase
VRDALGRRLDQLDPATVELLQQAALIGQSFGVTELAEIVKEYRYNDSDRQVTIAIAESLDEAVASGMLRPEREGTGDPGHFRFAHALIQRTIAEEITLAEQVRIHAAIGIALERLWGAQAGDHAAELAIHFANAEALVGSERPINYSLSAGDKALSNHAPSDAADHVRRALRLCRGKAPDRTFARAQHGYALALIGSTARFERYRAVGELITARDA